jgi:hypothetical protein
VESINSRKVDVGSKLRAAVEVEVVGGEVDILEVVELGVEEREKDEGKNKRTSLRLPITLPKDEEKAEQSIDLVGGASAYQYFTLTYPPIPHRPPRNSMVLSPLSPSPIAHAPLAWTWSGMSCQW